MKKNLLFVICLFIIFLTSGCGSSEFMKYAMSSWVGYSIDDVMIQWGYPSEERTIAGKKLVYWNRKWTSYVQQSSSDHYNSGYYKEYYCNRILEVDDKNIVTGWQWEGNGCPSRISSRGIRLMNPQNPLYANEKDKIRAEKEAAKHVGGTLRQNNPDLQLPPYKNMIENLTPEQKQEVLMLYNRSALPENIQQELSK